MQEIEAVIYGKDGFKASEEDKKTPRGLALKRLSPEDQVDCLIGMSSSLPMLSEYELFSELATDKRVLGRTYLGWEPWL